MTSPPNPTTAYGKLKGDLAGKRRRWLVTGAAGFIGSALVEELLRLGQEVIGLDNFATGYRENLDAAAEGVADAGERLRFVEADICDLTACHRACEGVDIVLHQAALGSVPRSIEDPLSSHQANVDGFLNVLLAARDAGVGRVVYASSSAVYGDDSRLPKVEPHIGRPLSPYAATKRINEVYADVVQEVYQLELVGLRYFNVFGRRQDPDGPYAAVIPRWIEHLIAGEPCVVFGDGAQSRDFCYVDNAVQANLLAGTCPAEATGDIYNVGCASRTDLVELFELLRERVAGHHPAAGDARPVHEAPRAGDVAHSQANVSRIGERLGYEPTHDIAAGLTETVNWFVAHRAAGR